MEHILNYKSGWKINYKVIVLHLFSAVPALILLRDYFSPGIQIVLGLMTIPFIFKIKQPGIHSFRYGWAAIAFLALFYFLNISVLIFLSAGCLILFSLELHSGKIGVLPFLILLCISPASYYVVNTFTFSIRLELSSYASILLNMIGCNVENHGSYFIMPDGYHFSVDTACIGLNMFNTGFFIALLMIGFTEQNKSKNINFISLGFIFCSTAFLLVFTNLMRIVALVLFRSEPGTASHEILGILSLVLYTVLPVFFIIKFIIKRSPDAIIEERPTVIKKQSVLISTGLAAFVLVAGLHVKNTIKQTVKDEKLAALQIAGYSKQTSSDGVAEFRQGDVLIYIKPGARGFESDHPPAMCWQGSGFKLDEITEVSCGNYKIMQAILRKDTIVQHTAWWYDNGHDKTISQMKWRLSKGEPYRIVNITTDKKERLVALCREFLGRNLFEENEENKE